MRNEQEPHQGTAQDCKDRCASTPPAARLSQIGGHHPIMHGLELDDEYSLQEDAQASSSAWWLCSLLL